MLKSLHDKLTCCICLDPYKEPVTTKCGHSFCRRCIELHWDRAPQGPAGGDPEHPAISLTYCCPECRCPELERPQLAASVTLRSIREVVVPAGGHLPDSPEALSAEPQPLQHLEPMHEQRIQALGRPLSPRSMLTVLQEMLVCSICREVYKKPVTAPCGHSFCRECIEKRYDDEQQGLLGAAGQVVGAPGYTCPVCGASEPRRPQLSNSVALCNFTGDVMWWARGEATGSPERRPSEQELMIHSQTPHKRQCQALCPRHGRPLELYCIPEQCCICCECTVRECREHPRALTEEQRRCQEKKLRETLMTTEHQLATTEAELCETKEKTKKFQDNSDKFIVGIAERFAKLHRILEECQALSEEVIQGVTLVALKQAESNLEELQSRKDALMQHRMKAEELLGCSDDVAFLQMFPLLSIPGAPVTLPAVEFPLSQKVAPIVEILSKVSKLLQEDLANSLHMVPSGSGYTSKESPVLKTPSAVKLEPSSLPGGALRTKLFKNYRNLTFDPNTANHYLQLSRQDRRVKHIETPSKQRPEHPDRFKSWQVLCCENFHEGSHYWEVCLSDYFVYLGVAYNKIDRKNTEKKTSFIGRNADSWSLQVQRNSHIAWHSGQEQKLVAPLYLHIGVHLDYSAGSLTFYGIGDKMELLHTFSCIFTAPVYPAFWIGEGVQVSLVHR
ncbi:E3 ubiquitin-protein ligase TRIM65-like [Pleurodeles waltl]|uniref:E3 ubiquitin-protein ligase TRIM65-like n=1 Tax=Pleurodeles waltl TaxID=8319 RepID=UPI0037095AEF